MKKAKWKLNLQKSLEAQLTPVPEGDEEDDWCEGFGSQILGFLESGVTSGAVSEEPQVWVGDEPGYTESWEELDLAQVRRQWLRTDHRMIRHPKASQGPTAAPRVALTEGYKLAGPGIGQSCRIVADIAPPG